MYLYIKEVIFLFYFRLTFLAYNTLTPIQIDVILVGKFSGKTFLLLWCFHLNGSSWYWIGVVWSSNDTVLVFFFFVYINFHVASAHFLSVFHCFFADKFYFPFKYTVGKNFGIYQLMKDFIGKDLKLWLEKLKGKYFSLEFLWNLNKNTDKIANTGSFDCIRFSFLPDRHRNYRL